MSKPIIRKFKSAAPFGPMFVWGAWLDGQYIWGSAGQSPASVFFYLRLLGLGRRDESGGVQ